ncbi:MAG: ABC transporter, partial [Mesorhizobium sp.]
MKSVRVVAGSLRSSAAALLVLTLAGCAVLGGKPAPLDTFELSAPSVDVHAHSRRQILIAQPSALKALDSQNI